MGSREAGKRGEDFAAEILSQEGYAILERNWRSGHKEIDLIVQKGDVLAFVEVKLRKENAWIQPEEAASPAQRRRIVLAAAAYLQAQGLYNSGAVQPRFDIFSVTADSQEPERIKRYVHLISAYDLEGLGVFL